MDLRAFAKTVQMQFARRFRATDSGLFRRVAEANLAEAAVLQVRHTQAPPGLGLLYRNARKRLLIGVGVELLLKAIYLRNGYGVNKLLPGSQRNFPYLLSAVQQHELNESDTYTLGQLIETLPQVVHIANLAQVQCGLTAARVFRNKEGHVVTPSHAYVPATYRAIERALVELYQAAFHSALTVRFGIASHEKGCWHVN